MWIYGWNENLSWISTTAWIEFEFNSYLWKGNEKNWEKTSDMNHEKGIQIVAKEHKSVHY